MPARVRRWAAGRFRRGIDALERLVAGLGTAVLAVAVLLWLLVTLVTCLVGVGFWLLPGTLRAVRFVADRERHRLSRWGPELAAPGPVPRRLRAAVRDSTSRREAWWLLCHATFGLGFGLVAVTLPLYVVRDVSFPLWWWLVPAGDVSAAPEWWAVDGFPDALGVALTGVGWLVVTLAVLPGLAWLQAWPGRRLLPPEDGTDLALRVAQLTATRAAALDAHAAELRRIERSLHDGTQNRLVAVSVLLGAARRALARDPASADAVLAQAQDAAEQSLAELRDVIRGILPPVLAERSLADALTGLATACPVPCRLDADDPGRCPASVEATAYFVVAESLTNVAKHAAAAHAHVEVRRRDDELRLQVTDDGGGGAREDAGTGLAGIRRRVEAHDGTFALASPAGGPTKVTVSLPCGS